MEILTLLIILILITAYGGWPVISGILLVLAGVFVVVAGIYKIVRFYNSLPDH